MFDLLFVDDDPEVLEKLEAGAKANHWSYRSLTDGQKALEILDRDQFSVMVTDLNLPGINGLQILEWIRGLPTRPEVLVLTEDRRVQTAVAALKLGAFDYLPKPFEIDRVTYSIRQALEKFNLLHRMEAFQEENKSQEFESIVGKSIKMQAIYEIIRQISVGSSNVLIQGESGTGKEMIAKAIHRNGVRKGLPFTVINCSAMPETLMEAELFGYSKGAFTGAIQDKQGLFEVADNGTVFLDEIGEVPLSIQVKLLRVLQEGEIRRIGETESRHIDVRLIAATNRDLLALTKKSKFREDLYYRLNVINIHVPPLRERSEDIVLLAYHFLKKVAKKMEKNVEKISIDVLQALQNYNWPGNVRELENTIERAVVFSDGDTIIAKNLPQKILSRSFYNVPPQEDLYDLNYKEAKKRALNIFNRSYIMAVLEKTGHNITAAAEKAEMDRSNFKKIIRKFHIDQKG